MNRLDTDTRIRLVSLLCEGMGVRPIVRATGVAKNTLQKLIREMGAACLRFHDAKVHGLKCGRIEADELWAFVGARQKHVRPERASEWGDIWLWSVLCSVQDRASVDDWAAKQGLRDGPALRTLGAHSGSV